MLAGRRPAKLVEPSRLRVGVSLRSPVAGVRPDEPNRDGRGRPPVELLVEAGHDTVAADPVYPTALGLGGLATWFAAAYREAGPPGSTVAALQPRTRRHVALGEWARRRGFVRDEPSATPGGRRSIDFFADHAVDLLLTPALAGAAAAAATLVGAVLAAQHDGQHAVRPVRRAVERRRPAGDRGAGRARARTGCRSPCSWSGRPARSCCCSRVAGQFEMPAPWPRHAPG